MSFHAAWMISLGVLVLLAGYAGWGVKRNALAILIDNRGRYSLTHLQVVVWTVLILSAMIGAFVAGDFDTEALVIPSTLLGLMGISAGSAVFATGIKASKDATGSTAEVAHEGMTIQSRNGSRKIEAKPSQIWLLEEGELADEVVDIGKFQGFVITLVVVVAFVTLTWREQVLPALPESVVWLIGISHAGYVAGKIPNRK